MHRLSRVLLPIGAAVLALTSARTVRSQTAGYTITPIAPRAGFGQGGAHFSLNNAGQVSGVATVSGATRAFRWSPATPNGTTGTLVNLGGYSSYQRTEGFGINSLGDVVGRASDVPALNSKLPQALFWPVGGAVQSLGGGGSVQEEAYAINTQRDVLLLRYSSKNTSTNGINFSRIASGKRRTYFLGPGWPADLNNAGQALGRVGGGNGASDGVPLWTPTGAATWTRQLLVPRGVGYDLNELGEVVGSYGDPVPGREAGHPFLYLPTARYGLPAGVNDLWSRIEPALPPPSAGAAWLVGTATGVNDHGVVVGEAVSYREDSPGAWSRVDRVVWRWDPVSGPQSLSEVAAAAGWTLDDYSGGSPRINNAGQIVTTAWSSGSVYCVLLTPAP